ncbi:MAG: hypothetical protein WCG27_07220, partial [Pseudomonadota bacterium]
MKTDQVKKKDEWSQLSISRIKDGLKELAEIKAEDLAKVSTDVLHTNIEEMLSVVKSMEIQLNDTMEVNTALKAESQDREIEILTIRRENSEIKQKLKELENRAPITGDVEKQLE